MVEKVADTDSTVLIYGESGTGKELITKAIHNNSYRKNKPFIPINCGAIPENLLESELFGHVQGAFTGATAQKSGKFELANGGTIFLDEIGDMSAELQIKILRVLEEREFERVGGSKSIKVDVRVIAATHRDLEDAVQKGNFRADLFYRLHVIPINVPSLRERREDIPLLASHFLKKFNQDKNRNVEGFSEEAMGAMMDYSWPGNVRELRNVIEHVVIMKETGEVGPQDLPEKLKRISKRSTPFPRLEITEEGICFNTAVSEFEKALIIQSLERTKWVKNKAAKLLHLNRTTLVEKIKKHRLHEVAC
jgi:transcriptional regulator with PAS, ATPase and Fis domain